MVSLAAVEEAVSAVCAGAVAVVSRPHPQKGEELVLFTADGALTLDAVAGGDPGEGPLRPQRAKAGQAVLAVPAARLGQARPRRAAGPGRPGAVARTLGQPAEPRVDPGSEPAGGRLASPGHERRREDIHEVVRAQDDHGRHLEEGDERGRRAEPRRARARRAPSRRGRRSRCARRRRNRCPPRR